MGKLILLILIIAGFYYFFLKPKEEIAKKEDEENEFVQCEKCGTFVLKKEMKEKNGKLLCKDCYENS